MSEQRGHPVRTGRAGRTPRVDGLPSNIRLIEPLGSGASSSVWRARDRSAGTDVAVKIVPRRSTRRRVDAERVERESRALGRLGSHPGILSVRSLGVNGDSAWIVTGLVDGGSLGARMAQGALSLRDILIVGASAADALEHAHARGVVHGDVTPANVLLDHDGRAVLADFGLAKLGDCAPADASTGNGGLTPAYAAPEMRHGAIGDLPADIYGLGASLWAASVGTPPARAGVPSPAEMPSGLASILRSCTDPDPARRPTAAHAGRMFRREQQRCGFETTEPTVATPVTGGFDGAAPLGLAPTRAQRVARTVALTAAVTFVLVVMVLLALQFWR